LVLQYFQIPFWRICVSDSPLIRARHHLFRYARIALKRIIMGRARPSHRPVVLFALAASPASLFCDNRHIAFEREQAVWIANLDGTDEKKIADGIFPAISPDGTRVAFNATEK